MSAAPQRGRLVSFEGGEGAGKSTAIAAAVAALQACGQEVVQVREPGGTALGEAIRSLLLAPEHRGMSAQTELLLMFASRAQLVDEVVRPALARGAWVVADRFTDASFAYQGGGRGFDAAVLAQLETWVQQDRQPDLTLWFDLPASVAAQRRAAARVPDRFEQQDLAFFERVRNGYARRAEHAPQRFRKLDAAGDHAGVWAQVEAALAGTGWW